MPTSMLPPARYASDVDLVRYGRYRARIDSADDRPLYRFAGRIGTDPMAEFPAEPGRYHLYSGWFCPWAQRTVIVRALKGLESVVTLSYVDHRRDGRGWAFREGTGPDPVNAFTLLWEAYERTEPGFDGHVSVPVLWDRVRGRIVSNTFADISIDLATAFERWAIPGVDLYPVPLRPQIDRLNEYLLRSVKQAAGAGESPRLHDAFTELDRRLGASRYLFGDAITESDVRLWVTLVRFDVGYNADGTFGARGLVDYPALWGYARDLYQQPAFRDSTDFDTFARLGVAIPDWDQPHGRDAVGGAAPSRHVIDPRRIP